MPTYQYQCTECGNSLEVRQSFTDDALTVCPECQGTLRKVFNAVGVVFKGSGFYRNDSRSSGTSTLPAKSEASSSSSESSSNGSKSSSDSSKSSSSTGSSSSSGSSGSSSSSNTSAA
ncbi:FmdB family zinc ribbon protein [Kribbella sp. NPDC051620]|uniref:FmdB family zinc ribbon protein n=1 Tax=Kribbella sp. NPDC051620 TaxID=3364120 RepID=UPI00378C8362